MLVGIVAQRGNDRAASMAAEVRERLREAAVEVWLDEATASVHDESGHAVDEMGTCDLAVSIGGDGTFLFTARGVGDTPIVGVNLGEVGFLNPVSAGRAAEAVLEAVESHRAGDLSIEEAPRLAATYGDWQSDPAVNELVLQGPRRGHGGGVDLEVRVDGSTFTSGRADGVLVATPTGSTAYNLSEGGPLVHPGVDCIVVTEMCPDDGMPPLVVDGESVVTVRLSGPETGHVVSDGRSSMALSLPVEVTVSRTDPPVRIAGSAADFFEALGKLERD